MLTQTQQVDLTLHHLKERTLSIYTPEQRASIEASEDWKQFDRRLEEHFPKLMHELDNVYNNNEAVLPMLEQLIARAWQSYSQRNASIKDIDIAREAAVKMVDEEAVEELSVVVAVDAELPCVLIRKGPADVVMAADVVDPCSVVGQVVAVGQCLMEQVDFARGKRVP